MRQQLLQQVHPARCQGKTLLRGEKVTEEGLGGLGALREIPIVFGPHGVTSDVHIYIVQVTSSRSQHPTQPASGYPFSYNLIRATEFEDCRA